jgi:hypothetical protein
MKFQAHGCSKILCITKQPMLIKLIQHINNRNKRKKNPQWFERCVVLEDVAFDK